MRLGRSLRSVTVAGLLAGAAMLAPFSARADAVLHAIAMHGTPKEPASFSHFAHVNPVAPKGGRLVLGVQGSFDSLNPLIVRGQAASGIRDFVIESLLTRGTDEPFTLYGLLAASIEVPDDRSAITFNINPLARFSDGKPVTADDVIFSFDVLREKGRPNHRTYYSKVIATQRLSDHKVRFTFAPGGDREMPLILGLMPILPRHLWTAESFEKTTLEPVVGSGPYTIAAVDAGRSITYARNPAYWGKDLPVTRGRFNFDEIRFEYYRDGASLFEAFKSGQVDLRPEEDPQRWADGYAFAATGEGRIVKAEFPIALPAGMTGLVFNTRRSVFASQKVRQALILAFDFEWVNRNLFHGYYKRTQSYFERSALSSAGRAADERERALLAPFPDAVKPDVLAGTHVLPRSDGSGHARDNLRAAHKLLGEAGYELKGGRMVAKAGGQQLSFEILAGSTSQERLLLAFAGTLERLGIAARVRTIDSAQYQARLRTYDYDMIQMTWPASLSPGNEQLFRWSSETARTEGSFNYAGVANPAADAMINALLAAVSREDFEASVRALDRVLISGDYVIPLFHLPRQWVAHWRHLKHPATTPLYGYHLDTWWAEGDK